MATLKLSRDLSLAPDQAWTHASNLSELGDWLSLHEGWRCDIPAEIGPGTMLVGVASAKGMRNRVTWTVCDIEPPNMMRLTGKGVGGTRYGLEMEVTPTAAGCTFNLKIDLAGRPLFGPIGLAAARAVKGEIEQSIERFQTRYA